MQFRFTDSDLTRLRACGIEPDEAHWQLQRLCRRQYVPLDRPCTLGDGIQWLPDPDHQELLARYDQSRELGRWTKFVPASGAASRMFAWADESQLADFGQQLPRLAFFDDLQRCAAETGQDLERLLHAGAYRQVAQLMLGESGLGYGSTAKALLKFHRYGAESRTAFEEHLHEAAACLSSARAGCRAHFTVSPEHRPLFESLLARRRPALAAQSPGGLDVSFSLQEHCTDAVALDEKGAAWRSADGALVLRPGGHGALLKNLNQLRADLVFVKNVDNICHQRWRAPTLTWIGLLGGFLVRLQEQIHRHQLAIETSLAEASCCRAEAFVRSNFAVETCEASGSGTADRRRELLRILARPLRVCGVVPTRGDCGGGPYWVREADGSRSLQIVESAEVDEGDPQQLEIFRAATHFNPVFMVLALRDHRQAAYDLSKFAERDRAIVARKYESGGWRRVLEHPGLWNGSMARWNTVFVEVPLEVFSPVKTIFDLLREEHQELAASAG